MTLENTVPMPKAGIADFERTSWGNHPELQYGDTPALATQSIRVKTTAADGLNLTIGSVVNIAKNGEVTLAKMSGSPKESNATHILAAHLALAKDAGSEHPFYVAGHFRQEALVFNSSFTTDVQKQAAFIGGEDHTGAPMILVSKAGFTDSNINL